MNNKQIRALNKILRKQIVQRFGVMAVALLVVGSVAYFGTHIRRDSHAATPAAFALTAPDGTTSAAVAKDNTVAVKLSVDTGGVNVNAVQASMTYDKTKLQYVSYTEGTAFPDQSATRFCSVDTTSCPASIARVARSITAGTAPQSGVKTVVTMTFKALITSGSTPIAFEAGYNYVMAASTNTNLLPSGAITPTFVVNFTPAAKPTVSAVSPSNGTKAGGTPVTITGTNFVSGATVKFGGVSATGVTVVSATQITATTPASSTASAVDVVVTNPDTQTGTKTGGYTYNNPTIPPPTISSIFPLFARSIGGGIPPQGSTTAVPITISGTNFVTTSGGTTVKVDGQTISNATVGSTTSLSFPIPAHTNLGPNNTSIVVPVTITTSGGTATINLIYELDGDYNGDGLIDSTDDAQMAFYYGKTAIDARVDFNHDGKVNSQDAAIIQANWR